MAARTFAFATGILYLLLGAVGFVKPALTAAPDSTALSITGFHGYVLGAFAVNFFLNLVHLATGAWGIAASRAAAGARAYARTIAVIYGIFAVLGTMPEFDTFFGFMPLGGNNVWLHGATAAIGAIFGWVFKRGATLTAGGAR